ncbi:Lactate utilization protein C [Geodia barretti]|uniref:Lactate utilization protein C n=1 Tax=Geodia barretti TaxID=519541 RepID=A0AA35RK99_GEOBA|nr:Lactate utilization protein C [Geodia barretti]
MSSREAFLSRVRQALRTGKQPHHAEAAPAENGEVVSLVTEGEDLAARLQRELEGVGGSVARVKHVAEAAQYVTRLAKEKGAKVVVRWQSDLLDTLEIDDALQAGGANVHTASPGSETEADDRRQEMRDLLAHADIGLSGVDAVIAETGTLMLTAQPGQMRGVSLLPPVHVAVARTDQIVATFADALRNVRQTGGDVQQNLTSCISFVTGPSRTGDIELKLTVGVHGPGELHLVLLDEPGN